MKFLINLKDDFCKFDTLKTNKKLHNYEPIIRIQDRTEFIESICR